MSGEPGDTRYPVGRFAAPAEYTPELRAGFIDAIAEAPARLREAVAGLSHEQLLTPYREGGWTVAQVVHHVPDSHMNSYARFKLAATEAEPRIKDYDEDAWARLPDAVDPATVPSSLDFLEALHARWVRFLRTLTPDDLARAFVHPEYGRASLDRTLALYAWHGRHHTAHVTSLRQRMGW